MVDGFFLFVCFLLCVAFLWAGIQWAMDKGWPAFPQEKTIASSVETAEQDIDIPDGLNICLTREQLLAALRASLAWNSPEIEGFADKVYAFLYKEAVEDRSGSHEKIMKFHAKLEEEVGESSVHDVEE